MGRRGHLSGGAHAAHVHVAVNNICGCLSTQLRMAAAAGIGYEVPQLIDGDGRLQESVLNLRILN